jgi:hypothetical protein
MANKVDLELVGSKALEYANAHLRKVRVIAEKWETEYEDVITGDVWLLDYPHSQLHGGGEPRLRKIEKKP